MCSDREMVFQCDVIKESPSKYLQIIWTLERPDIQPNPECVRMEFFKIKIWEQQGDDLLCNEAQTVDLSGYFPKSVLNKLQSSIILDSAKQTYLNFLDIE